MSCCQCQPVRAPLGRVKAQRPAPRLLDVLSPIYEGSIFEAASFHLLIEALTETNGNQKRASELLRVSTRVMAYNVAKHGVRDLCRMLGGGAWKGVEDA